MKQYIELMEDILRNGIDTGDRTGVGRRKVFGRQLRFNVSDGTLPLATTCQTPFKNVIKETLWFITGSTSNKDLNDQGVNIWNQWAVGTEDIENFIAKYFPNYDQDGINYVKPALTDAGLHEIGNMYGRAWRNIDSVNFNLLWPDVAETDFAPDRLALIRKEFDEKKPTLEDGKPVDWSMFMKFAYYNTIDQLQELLLNLKRRPFSSRLIISAWVPEYLPFEELPPQENVLLGRGALAPCHVLQQYLVFPPKVPGGKNRLSLMMTQR